MAAPSPSKTGRPRLRNGVATISCGATTTTRLARRVGEGRRVAPEGLDVVGAARDRDADHEGVGRGVVRDHGQDLAERRLLVSSAAVMSTGLAVAAKPGRMARSFAWVSSRSGASSSPALVAASAAMTQVAPEFEIATMRRPAGVHALQVELRRLDELRRVADAPDAVLLEEGVDDPVLVGERARMGARRALAGGRAAGFQRHDRQAVLARDGGGLREVVRIAGCSRGRGGAAAGPGSAATVAASSQTVTSASLPVAWAWRTPMPRRAQQAVGHDAHGAALAHDADRAVLRRDLVEHGREARDRAGAEIREPLRVRPDHAHAARPRPRHHGALRLLAASAPVSPKPERHHDGDLDAHVAAFVERRTAARPAPR